MDPFDELMRGPWKELGTLLVPAAYRAAPAQRPAELNYLKTANHLRGIVRDPTDLGTVL